FGAIWGVYVLAVGHPGYRGDIHIDPIGYILQYHGAELAFIPTEEIFALVFHDGTHGDEQGLLSLFYGVYEPFGGIEFLFDEKHGILLGFGLLGGTLITFQHIAVFLGDMQLRGVPAIEGEFEFPIDDPDGKSEHDMLYDPVVSGI